MIKNRKDPHRYDDMLEMPHHESDSRPQMPLQKRAAQFAAYKALTGFDDNIEETSRKAVEKAEHDIEHETFYD